MMRQLIPRERDIIYIVYCSWESLSLRLFLRQTRNMFKNVPPSFHSDWSI